MHLKEKRRAINTRDEWKEIRYLAEKKRETNFILYFLLETGDRQTNQHWHNNLTTCDLWNNNDAIISFPFYNNYFIIFDLRLNLIFIIFIK